jgi:hypothetical protein
MCRDCYEVELPEPTFVEKFAEDKEMYKIAGLAVGIPTGIFIASCILQFWVNRKST